MAPPASKRQTGLPVVRSRAPASSQSGALRGNPLQQLSTSMVRITSRMLERSGRLTQCLPDASTARYGLRLQEQARHSPCSVYDRIQPARLCAEETQPVHAKYRPDPATAVPVAAVHSTGAAGVSGSRASRRPGRYRPAGSEARRLTHYFRCSGIAPLRAAAQSYFCCFHIPSTRPSGSSDQNSQCTTGRPMGCLPSVRA